MIQWVWLMDRDTSFERDWIEELRQGTGVPFSEIVDLERTRVIPNAVFIFNHGFAYEEYFQKYEEAGVSFGAIHLSDETLGDTCRFYDHAMCKFVFRNYYHPVHSQHPKATTFGLGYKQGFGKIPAASTSQAVPWYHWCFAGNVHDDARKECLVTASELVPYFVHTTFDSFNSVHGLRLDEYRHMMESSKFSLCPVGQGNLDTFRFYESFEAGTIPVVLGNSPYQNYLPQTYWHNVFPWTPNIPAILAASWKDAVEQMKELLQNPACYIKMRASIAPFWKKAKANWSTSLRDSLRLLKEAP
jgi:hypothetical protein